MVIKVKQSEEDKKIIVEKYENTKSELLFLKGKHDAYCNHRNLTDVHSNHSFDLNLSTFMLELKKYSHFHSRLPKQTHTRLSLSFLALLFVLGIYLWCDFRILSDFVFLYSISNEIKVQHANEVRIMRNQIKNLESEKCDLDIKLASVTSERDHLEGYVSAIERETKYRILNFRFILKIIIVLKSWV